MYGSRSLEQWLDHEVNTVGATSSGCIEKTTDWQEIYDAVMNAIKARENLEIDNDVEPRPGRSAPTGKVRDVDYLALVPRLKLGSW